MQILFNFQKSFLFLLFIFLFGGHNHFKAQITCPYPVTNSTGCPGKILYELLDNTCNCPPGCSSTIPLNTGPAPLMIGSPAQCTATGYDIILRVVQLGTTPYGPPVTCVDGGCFWTTSYSATETSCAAAGIFSINWTSSGATITSP